MMHAVVRRLWWVSVGVWVTLGGCAVPQRAAIAPRGSAVPPFDTAFLWSDYDSILHRVVTGGMVDYLALAEQRAVLDGCIANLATVGPKSTPVGFGTDEARLAYWINAHNVTTLHSVSWIAQPVAQDAKSERLEKLKPSRDPATALLYQIDGGWLTPIDMRIRALRLAGEDWRVQLVLCNGRRGGPALWREAFTADVLSAQLNAAVREFVTYPQVVFIDHGMQRLRLSSELWALRGRLLTDMARQSSLRSPTMVEWLRSVAPRSHRSTMDSATGYAVRRLDYDRRINHMRVTM